MAIGTYVHARAAAEQVDHHYPFMTDTTLYGCWLWILSFFFPPVAVFLERGCGNYITCKYESPIYYNPESFSPATLANVREHRITFSDAFQPGSEDERQERWRKRGGVASHSSTDHSSTEDNDSDLDKPSRRARQGFSGGFSSWRRDKEAEP
ncbi:hypothetical protein C6P46_002177 [Rhodotorula mucilaginosa]|uniref:Uncharacterized protein n=1 Tax=Rhodotorula mucilaginosa TaxID=5537 RepID=A0A9P7B1Q6_RHOMI|nr:hypothetical protein C6P46_002177 [Rhodotorula mucilaginosa]